MRRRMVCEHVGRGREGRGKKYLGRRDDWQRRGKIQGRFLDFWWGDQVAGSQSLITLIGAISACGMVAHGYYSSSSPRAPSPRFRVLDSVALPPKSPGTSPLLRDGLERPQCSMVCFWAHRKPRIDQSAFDFSERESGRVSKAGTDP